MERQGIFMPAYLMILTDALDTALARGGEKRSVPYGQLSVKNSKFIKSKYLPKKFTLKRPHLMRMDEIIDFVTHVHARQQDGGVKDAFRFSHFEGKNGELDPAHYPDDIDEDGAAVNNPRPRARPKRSKKAKTVNPDDAELAQLQDVLRFDNAGVSPPPALEGIAVIPPADHPPAQSIPLVMTSTTTTAQLPPQYTMASHIEMQAINGMLPNGACPLPLNGPNDAGMPQYAIPTVLYAQIGTQPDVLPTQPMLSNPTFPITPRETPGADDQSRRTRSKSTRKDGNARGTVTRQGSTRMAGAPDDDTAPRRSTRSTTQIQAPAAAAKNSKGKKRA